MKLSIVMTLYNSAPYIEQLYERTVAATQSIGDVSYEIVLVNDHSPDESLAIAKQLAVNHPNLIIIDLARNFGQANALMVGMAHASGDYVFILDSDLEEQPEWLALFFAQLDTKACDVVYGVNTHPKDNIGRAISRVLFYKLLNFLAETEFPKNICTARLMTRQYVDALMQFQERELFLGGLLHVTGFSQLPVEVKKIGSSPTNYSISQLLTMAVNAITAFTTRPLSIIAVAGIGLSIVAVLYTGWIMYKALVYRSVLEGWTSVMAGILLIGGMTLFFNGVMAIYIAKIFLEVKQRPRTIIREIHRSQSGAHGGKHTDAETDSKNLNA